MNLFDLNSVRRSVLAFLALLVLASCGGGGGASGAGSPAGITAAGTAVTIPVNTFSALLTGTQETPQNGSAAVAVGAVMLDPVAHLMKASINAAAIAGTMAHIHLGAVGIAGPIIFPMTELVPGSGVWSTQASVSDAQISNFAAGNYYFNVHSAAFPAGEIRGQIALLPILPLVIPGTLIGNGVVGNGLVGTNSLPMPGAPAVPLTPASSGNGIGASGLAGANTLPTPGFVIPGSSDIGISGSVPSGISGTGIGSTGPLGAPGTLFGSM